MKMMSEYEEVNATDNCVTMITVMPGSGTSRFTLTSSGGGSGGLAEAGSLGGQVLDMQTTSTRESETSSSEGGSFIIDSAAFYENLNFHRMRSNILERSAFTEEDLAGPNGPNWSKFGYSLKEVWNWLYTDHDIDPNRRFISTQCKISFHIEILMRMQFIKTIF